MILKTLPNWYGMTLVIREKQSDFSAVFPILLVIYADFFYLFYDKIEGTDLEE